MKSRQAKTRLSAVRAGITVLRTHIINYFKTRDVYVAYRKELLKGATPEQLLLMKHLISIHDSGIIASDEWTRFLDIIFSEQEND